ncbi:DUF3047 domain-containing protein [Polaromonas sp.]|uniref:DUF3047 domain-containing protein n=1 Tax=Polaromonas sp. TaxID=1869339 RepID=UPI003751A05C
MKALVSTIRHLGTRLALLVYALAPAMQAHAQASTQGPLLAAFSSASGVQPPSPWRVVGVPGGKISLTAYALVELDGRKVLRVEADKSYGNLVHDLPAAVPEAGVQLRWRWRLDEALRGGDLRRREGDDSPLKVCALFDMPLDKLGLIERNLLRLARAASGEKLPSATLCYVWDGTLAPGTLLSNAYTARVRFIVLDSGEQRLGQWVAHSRNLGADFRRAFGKESDAMPPLQAVLVGADADNTGGRSLGHVGDVTLSP